MGKSTIPHLTSRIRHHLSRFTSLNREQIFGSLIVAAVLLNIIVLGIVFTPGSSRNARITTAQGYTLVACKPAVPLGSDNPSDVLGLVFDDLASAETFAVQMRVRSGLIVEPIPVTVSINQSREAAK